MQNFNTRSLFFSPGLCAKAFCNFQDFSLFILIYSSIILSFQYLTVVIYSEKKLIQSGLKSNGNSFRHQDLYSNPKIFYLCSTTDQCYTVPPDIKDIYQISWMRNVSIYIPTCIQENINSQTLQTVTVFKYTN